LPDQSLMFGVGVAERIISGARARSHRVKDVTNFDLISACPHLFASINGNGQNFGSAVFRCTDQVSIESDR